jgi:hypothetical protein
MKTIFDSNLVVYSKYDRNHSTAKAPVKYGIVPGYVFPNFT